MRRLGLRSPAPVRPRPRLAPEFSSLDAEQRAHARAFTMAKSAGFDILDDIYQALLKAFSEGKTFRHFAAELNKATRPFLRYVHLEG